MIPRFAIKALHKWASKTGRKPLVLRGARQVGKTTLINQFSAEFTQFVSLNLELETDREPFTRFRTVDKLLQELFFLKNQRYTKKERTLIFIDEIQELPEAINLLRFFYEQAPELYVIAAGSLLETVLSDTQSFPVGRVEFLVLRPLSFPEFLEGTGEHEALKQLQQIPLADFARDKLLRLFHTYALIGGMPEIVNLYAQTQDLTAVAATYDSLIAAYLDDVEKYAGNNTQLQVIRHAIRAAFVEAGKRIKFQGFGRSNYRSREMGEALRILEKTLLLSLIYPTTKVTMPLSPELQRSPRLQVLDTGLMNYYLGVQKEILGSADLSTVYQGTVIEHLVGQELLATEFTVLNGLHFWVREKTTSSAEVDYVIPFNGHLIPLEVKAGKEGKLKSLHLFMKEAPHQLALRLYSGELNITTVNIDDNKKYFLLNLPYFLVSQIQQYLEWFSKKAGEQKLIQ